MSTLNFDFNDFNKLISDVTAKAAPKLGKNDYTKTSYLPKGTHTLSFFFDPDKEMYRDVAFHKPNGSKIKCHCPNKLNKANERNPKWAEIVQSLRPEYKEQKLTQLPACEICALNKAAQELDKEKYGDPKKGKSWKEKLGIQYNTLLYVNLYDTTNPGEYWKPDAKNGTPYVVIGTGKLKESFNKMLEAYHANPAAKALIIKALNPSVATPPFTLIATEGTAGQVNITSMPQDEKPAIIENENNLPTWWRPLNKVFLSESFNPDDYDMNVNAAREIFAKIKKELTGEDTPLPEKKPSQAPLQMDGGNGGEVEDFLERNGVFDVKVPDNVPNLHLREEIETPKEFTPTEVKMEKTGELAPNQRLTSMDQIVTLPDYAIERNCWTKFDGLDPLCSKCPHALECSLEAE